MKKFSFFLKSNLESKKQQETQTNKIIYLQRYGIRINLEKRFHLYPDIDDFAAT